MEFYSPISASYGVYMQVPKKCLDPTRPVCPWNILTAVFCRWKELPRPMFPQNLITKVIIFRVLLNFTLPLKVRALPCGSRSSQPPPTPIWHWYNNWYLTTIVSSWKELPLALHGSWTFGVSTQHVRYLTKGANMRSSKMHNVQGLFFPLKTSLDSLEGWKLLLTGLFIFGSPILTHFWVQIWLFMGFIYKWTPRDARRHQNSKIHEFSWKIFPKKVVLGID